MRRPDAGKRPTDGPGNLGATMVLVAATTAFAAKTDVVILGNGDRFTCEVKQLSRGQLKLATDDAGTIYLKWDKIAAVTTTLPDEVVVTVGVLAPAPNGQLKITADSGATTVLAFLDVVSFAPIKAGFLERIDGPLDIGGSYTKSSGVGQMSVDLDAAYRRPSFKAFTSLVSTLTQQSGSETITQFTWQTGYIRFRDNGWIVSPFIYAARNVDLGLSLGGAAALTAGRYLERSNRSETLVAVGAAAGREGLIDGRTISDLDAVATVTTSFYRHDYPKSAMALSLLVFPELNRLGRVRANANVRLSRELFRDFITAITAYGTFDSQPQVEGVSRNDVGISFSIGWTF
jgi:hypothetical protein